MQFRYLAITGTAPGPDAPVVSDHCHRPIQGLLVILPIEVSQGHLQRLLSGASRTDRRMSRVCSPGPALRLTTLIVVASGAASSLGIIPAPIVRHWRITMAGHRFSAGWMLALSAAAAFVVGASAQEGMRAVRGVVTPDNPIWGQDPQTTPPPQQEETTGRAGGAAATRRLPRVRTGRSSRRAAKTDEGIFKVHRVGDTLYYEIPKARARQGLPLGHADQEDDDRRRLRRSGGRQPRRALGAEGRPRAAREHRLQHRRRSDARRLPRRWTTRTTRRSSGRSTSRPTPRRAIRSSTSRRSS